MNKMEFFKILEEGLIDFPAHELQEILYDYKEHFSNAQSDGKTEEEIIEELGDPYTIVNQYRSNYMQVSATNTEYEDTYEEKEPINETYTNYSDDSNEKYSNNTNNSSNSLINTILKICMVIGLLILFFPIGVAGLATVFGLGIGLLAIPFAFSISGILMLLGKFGFTILGFGVPAFFADFPTSVTLLITIGSVSATLICFILLIYLIKFIILIIKKLINKLSNKEGI
ncbi:MULTISPECIES: DUF1700 domain-containing protein [Clostridium]|uniref:DUF1700 domain-containing protein n=2 Tax=Clostridiaceae TaxID=31979 RepID=UPI000C0743C6|nr:MULTISPECIES: DUF1700 domain-containing protein [Clostridium]MBS7131235.1 DUF1700 domain-containing protein [Clostridium sp.]MDB2074921.1 DUF1700 domain-containing protein [Clostridium paraputrificum]MDB2078296.1 DUF1700 domain-containing protein [Clostridium paraputrificum]MDB2091745.1 DUF1700 domain-containing protein [Clostridium paraputrificum]MDB2098710.1 DUF1700 domain-containing protein [Clostridium paraputrificum]